MIHSPLMKIISIKAFSPTVEFNLIHTVMKDEQIKVVKSSAVKKKLHEKFDKQDIEKKAFGWC